MRSFRGFNAYFAIFAEKGDIATKRNTIKKLVHMVLNGERVGPALLMFVIR